MLETMEEREVRQEILEFFYAGGMVQTRLREASHGDYEFLQRGSWDIPEELQMSEEDLIRELHRLESSGQIQAASTVHPYASDEFLIDWKR
jgi:hypothetical protein